MPLNTPHDEDGHTALTIASSSGHLRIVHLLLSHGADPNAQTRSHHTPLFCAAGRGHADIVALLLSSGADPNGAEENGRLTPLAVAAVRGHEEAVWALLDGGGEGLDVDRKGRADGRTVLSHSAEDGQEGIVARLLDRGADLEARDTLGRTA